VGHSLEHVTRQLKKHLHVTATDIVNQARMEYAACQLKMSDAKIIDISLECGYNNMGHFYKLFDKQFGVTPRRYRLKNRALAGQTP